MTEQEMQFELMKLQEKVNALRQEVAAMNKECECWQHCRTLAAIAAMQVFIEHPNGESSQIIAKDAVRYADALVAELKRSDDVYAECRKMDSVNTASVCENMTKLQKELQKKGERANDAT